MLFKPSALSRCRFIFFLFITLLSVCYGTLVSSHLSEIAAWLSNSDQLTIPAFVDNVSRNTQNFWGWQLSRATFLFPDTVIYFLIYYIGVNPITAAVISALPIQMLWIYLVYHAFPIQVPDHPDIKWAWALVVGYWIPLILAQCFPALTCTMFQYFFSAFNHFSCFLLSACFLIWSIEYIYTAPQSALTDSQPTNHNGLAIIGLGFFLLTLSNPLIYIYFFTPLFILFFILPYTASQTLQRLYYLFCTLCAVLLISVVVNRYINKQMISAIRDLNELPKQLNLFFTTLYAFAKGNPPFAIGLFLIFLIYFLSIKQCWHTKTLFLKKHLSTQQTRTFLLQLLFVFAGLLNVLAAILPWEKLNSVRYLMFFFFSPFLLLPPLLMHYPIGKQFINSLKALCITGLVLVIISIYLAAHTPWSFEALKKKKKRPGTFVNVLKN